MSSDSLPDFDEWLADVGWLPISYEAIGARRAWDYLSAATEARADSAVPSSHVSETDDKPMDGGFHAAYAEGFDDGKAQGESILREALARLVALKDLKMQVEALAFGGFKCEFTTNGFKYEPKKELHDRLLAEYNRSKGPAWEAARSALAGIPR